MAHNSRGPRGFGPRSPLNPNRSWIQRTATPQFIRPRLCVCSAQHLPGFSVDWMGEQALTVLEGASGGWIALVTVRRK